MVMLDKLLSGGFVSEMRLITKLTIPLFMTQVLQASLSIIALVFSGRLGSTELAGVGLSLSLINITGTNTIMGLSTACDTLFAQTFGSINKHRLGIVQQRAVIIMMLSLMPYYALHLNTEIFLLAIGKDPRVAELSGDYMLIVIPGLAAFSVYAPIAKYIQCQDIVVPNMVIGALSNVVCAVAHYALIFHWELGTNGSAWAMTSG